MRCFGNSFGRGLAISGLAAILAGCGTSGGRAPVNFLELADVLAPLPGAKGKAARDQDKIDDTIARACSTGVLGTQQCQLHSKASVERGAELKGE